MMTVRAIFLVALVFVGQVHSLSTPVTIAVCTGGVDCGVDGASACFRQLQKNVSSSGSVIKVTGRPCMGPCGDGPCVRVFDADGRAIVSWIKQTRSKLALRLQNFLDRTQEASIKYEHSRISSR
jgi:hypothetical protein